MSKKRIRSSGASSPNHSSSSGTPDVGFTAVRRFPALSFWLGALVVFATIMAYLPALNAGFIWNDSDYVTAPSLRSLAGLARIWSDIGATEQYYPLLHSVFWIQYQLFGDQPAAYHLVNLFLHLGAVLLFGIVLRKILAEKFASSAGTGRSPSYLPEACAWLAAALFALHPVHVATVAWVTEQKNTLSLTLYLAALLVYLHFDEKRQPLYYFSALVLFGLSILSKTATVTLPAALLVVFWWQRGRLDWKRDMLPLLPWLVLGAAAGIFTSWVEQTHLGGEGLGAKGENFDLSWPGHLLLAGRALWFYLGSLAWPFDLNFIYPRWVLDGTVWWQWLFPLAAIGALGALWAMRHRSRAPLAVLLLFAGSLFPVLGFVNLFGSLYSRVWDHWQYLADLAPLALVGVWAGRRFHRVGIVTGVGLCILFGVLTWHRCADFQDNETLYRSTLARNPDCWMAHNNLGQLLAQTPSGLPEALNHYEAAVRLSPDVPELHFNHANALAKTNVLLLDAVKEYEEALRLDPEYAMAHNALGNVLARIDGRLPDAIAHYQQALKFTPGIADIHNNLGIALLMSDRTTEALAQFETALQLNPGLAQVHLNMASVLESMGRAQEAAAHIAAARKLGAEIPTQR